VIVKLRVDSSLVSANALSPEGRAARAGALGARLGLEMSAGSAVSDLAQVVLASGLSSAELAARLGQESDVEYAVPDERRRIVGGRTTPSMPSAWPATAGDGPVVPARALGEVRSSLNVEPAWAVTTGSPGIVVAAVDTGVRYEHPDLLSVAVGATCCPDTTWSATPARPTTATAGTPMPPTRATG